MVWLYGRASSGMSIQRLLQQAAAGTGDTGDDDFANVVLLLDGDGTGDDNNETFTDSSTNGFTVTESGSVVQGSFSPYGDNWSNYFNDDGYLQVTKSTDLDLDTNNWTIECWLNLKSASAVEVVLNFGYETETTRGYLIYLNSDGTLHFAYSTNGSNNTDTSMGSHGIVANEWTHLAVVRNGSTITGYINGSALGTTINIGSSDIYYPTSGNFRIGSDATNNLAGYMSNLRLVNGTAVYTSNFTPSTSPLTNITNTKLLMCQSNRFADNSSSSHAIAVGTGTPKVTPFSPFKDDDARDITTDGGSAYFNGAKLDVGSASDFAFGTGDFTVDAWVYLNSDVTTSIFNVGGASTGSFGFYYNASTKEFELVRYGDAAGSGQSSAQSAVGQWFHLRGIRSGGTTKLFINGVEDTGASYSMGSITASNLAEVGGGVWEGTNTTNAYIADLRVEVGTATSTSNFTPPTSPVSTTANTDLLLNFQDAGIYDRSGINNLDTVGDARLGFAPIYGTGSLAFDGTGDYLSIPDDPVFDLGSGDFTIECWANTSSFSSAYNVLVSQWGSSSQAWIFRITSSLVGLYANIGGTQTYTASVTNGLNQWDHFAVSREGSSLRFFKNGTLLGTSAISGTIANSTSNITVGILSDLNSTTAHDGFIDDLRVTKGVARYTSDFTPPDEIDLSTDTHREYVTLFLDGDGTANGQNNTFTDSSTNGFTVTESGSVVQGVFSPYGDNWSNSFDGNSDAVTIPDSTDFDFGTGDFTMEAWVYPTGVSDPNNYPSIVSAHEGTDNTSWIFAVTSTNKLMLYGGGGNIDTSTSDVPLNEWTHVMVTRSSGTVRFFINGTLDASTYTRTGNYNCTASGIAIGKQPAAVTRYWQGWISNLRLVKGTALQTSSFTPSTTPLTAVTNTVLLACQSNRFVDNSSSSHTLTPTGTASVSRFSPFESDKPYDITTDGGSGHFDNSSSSLAVSSGVTTIGTSDFTVECWFFVDHAATDYEPLYDGRKTSPYSDGVGLFTVGTKFEVWGSAKLIETSTGVFARNEWNHVALVRSSGSLQLYLNGTALGSSASYSGSLGSDKRSIGVNATSVYKAGGYISDLREVHSALYTSSFTPPTAPLTAVTNTELLLNFQDSAIPDLSGINNIDTVGNAKVGGTDPTKYGSNAMAFDGSGDYLKGIASADELNMGTGDWTIEGWYYVRTRTTAYPLIIGNNDSGFNAGALAITTSNNDSAPSRHEKLTLADYDDATTRVLSASSAHNLNQWYHFAVVRNGTNITIYRDGTSVASKTISSALTYDWGLNGVLVGGGNWDGANSYSDAIFDDLRITKGVARYTANFTPPTDALPKF